MLQVRSRDEGGEVTLTEAATKMRELGVDEAQFDSDGNVVYVRLGKSPTAAAELESAKAKDEGDSDALLYAAS